MIGIEHIGTRIKYLREKEGLSQAAFAKKIGVSLGNVGDWESPNKKSTPGAKAIHAISCEFNVSTDWIISGEDHYLSPPVQEHYVAEEADSYYIERQQGTNSHEDDLLELFRKLSYEDQLKTIGYIEGTIDRQDKKATSSNSTPTEDAATDETA
ncbi:hypothetical protein A0U40_17460 [[Bacillus] sp. KCTC 13219]|nr:hypothetical protein A0U40_17460 [[Bacillus] sp. KCTC 13219]